MSPLRQSELLFYQVGVTREEAMDALERQFISLKGFARWIIAQVHAAVLDDPMIACDMDFINAIKLRDIRFDPEQMRMDYQATAKKTKKGDMVVA